VNRMTPKRKGYDDKVTAAAALRTLQREHKGAGEWSGEAHRRFDEICKVLDSHERTAALLHKL
jgi:hypothetical protein